MTILYTIEEYSSAKTTDLLRLQCENCKKVFFKSKKKIAYNLLHNDSSCKYCSRECFYKSRETNIKVNCYICNKEFTKIPARLTTHNFCSHKCSCKYALSIKRSPKKQGTNRSKLEIYIEEQLKSLYPNLEILFNDRKAINSELDIYIPSLRLAFELNGIFHYEPIHGQDKLDKTVNNDFRKFAACNENKISLCVIDTSQQKYVKESTSKKYLDIIQKILNTYVSI